MGILRRYGKWIVRLDGSEISKEEEETLLKLEEVKAIENLYKKYEEELKKVGLKHLND